MDTNGNGVCFICLTSNNCHIYDEKKVNGDSTTSTAFKMLLHYLKVDLRKATLLGLAASNEASTLQNVKLSVFLCGDCSSAANEFLGVYQQFENIRLELDLRVRQLHSFMEKGGRDLEFGKRVNTGEMQARIGSVIVDMERLREEALEKVGQRVQRSLQRIPFTDLGAELEEMDDAANFSSPPVPLWRGENPLDLEEQFLLEQPEIKKMRCGAYESVTDVHSDFAEDESMHLDISNLISTKEAEEAYDALEIADGGMDAKTRAADSEEFVSEETGSAEEDEDMNANGCAGIVQRENATTEGVERTSCVEQMESVDDETGSGSSVVFLTEIEMDENSMSIDDEIAHGESSATSEVDMMPAVGPLNSELTTTSQQWKCAYCHKTCPQKGNLLTHQLIKHATSLLSKRGLIPPGISEQQLETAVATCLERGAPCIKCPFPICESKQFQHNCFLKIHLLKHHLEEVVDEATKVSIEDGGPYMKGRKSEWKCIPCRKYFSTCQYHQLHFLNVHTYTHLSSQGRLPPGISEEQLKTSLEGFLAQVRDFSTNFQCPLCGKRGFRKRKARFREHLLQTHLQEVLDNVENDAD